MQFLNSSHLVKRVLSFLYLSLFVVTPLLIYHRTSELFEFNKILFIYLVTGLVSAVWVFEMIQHRKIILKKTFLDPFILLFAVSQILSTLFSIDQHTSIFGYYGRFNGGLLSTFSYVVLYYCYVSHIPLIFNKEWVLKMMKISVFIASIVVVWGISGWYGFDASCALFTGALNNSCWTESFKPSVRMFSTLGQPNWLGAYCAVNLSFAFYFFNRAIESGTKLLGKATISSVLTISLLYAAIFATKSRSALLAAFSVTMLYMGYLFLKKDKTTLILRLKRPFLIIGLVGVIAMAIFKTGIPVLDKMLSPSQLINTTTEVKTKTQPNEEFFISKSSDIRKIVWDGAIKLGVMHPLFGTGVETFGYAYYFTRPVVHNLTSEWDYLYNRAHNEYLNMLATSGFLGFLSYVLLIGAVCFYIFLRRQNGESRFLATALGGGYVALLITNFFGFATSTSSLFFFLIPAFVLSQRSESDEIQKKYETKPIWPVAYGLPVLMVVGSVLFVVSYFKADVNYNLGNAYLESQDFPSSISYLQKALTYKYEHVYEDKLSYAFAQAALLTHADLGQKDPNASQKLLEAARAYNAKTIASSGKNLLYYKTASKVEFLAFQISGQERDFETSIDALSTAQKLAPTEPKIPYTKALFYSSYYDAATNKTLKATLAQNAMYEVNKAIELKGDYRDAYLLKGTMHAKFGETTEARESFEYILKHIVKNDQEAESELEKLK